MRIKDIIDLWPSRRDLWLDLRERHPVLAYATVRSWWQRDSISAEYFEAIQDAARRRNIDVTSETLVHAAAESARVRTASQSMPELIAV